MVKATTTSFLRAAAVLAGIAGGTVPLAAEEVLPWANTPPVAVAEPASDPAMEAAVAQCSGQFEAACRDLSTCAWVADIALQDGGVIPARCVARSPIPPKAAAKPAATKKKTAETPKAPAVKATAASETETGALPDPAPPAETKAVVVPAAAPLADEAPPVAEKKQPAPPAVQVTVPAPAPEPETKAAAVEPAPEPEAPPPVAEKKQAEPSAETKAETASEEAKKKAEQQAKSPVVVTPPSGGAAAPMPSFGSVPTAFPMGNAVVTTTVPPKSSE